MQNVRETFQNIFKIFRTLFTGFYEMKYLRTSEKGKERDQYTKQVYWTSSVNQYKQNFRIIQENIEFFPYRR